MMFSDRGTTTDEYCCLNATVLRKDVGTVWDCVKRFPRILWINSRFSFGSIACSGISIQQI